MHDDRPTVTVNYGPDHAYRVELRIGESGDVEGRYLATPAIPHDGPWEPRESMRETSPVLAAARGLINAWKLF
jgi:hypothetical protein